jgi:hypothetical protein
MLEPEIVDLRKAYLDRISRCSIFLKRASVHLSAGYSTDSPTKSGKNHGARLPVNKEGINIFMPFSHSVIPRLPLPHSSAMASQLPRRKLRPQRFLLHTLGLISFAINFRYLFSLSNKISNSFGGHFQYFTNISEDTVLYLYLK